MFACNAGEKRIAVCAASSGGSAFGALRYRFGDSHGLELEFPARPMRPQTYASGNHLRDGMRGTLVYLRMTNRDTSYTVFSEAINPAYQGDGASERSGVMVERNGKVLGRHMCDAQGRTYAGMLLDPKFLGVAVPLDSHVPAGFAGYRP
ncbi:hypothetical protein [Fulvimonas soli]|jgi:hypothetical protein|nr:hypothetical protein [Fulvimonas soli]HWB95337.1 hypothetical protein [Bryobacteraceae bacterium]